MSEYGGVQEQSANNDPESKHGAHHFQEPIAWLAHLHRKHLEEGDVQEGSTSDPLNMQVSLGIRLKKKFCMG